MYKGYVLFFFTALLTVAACNSDASGDKGKRADSTAVAPAALADQPDLSKTDSIEILYFPNPTDQKVYDHTFVKDTAVIRKLTNYVLNTEVQKNPCANDYKMYLFRNGDVYKTIYAATADSCRYFAYVVNGVTHFTGLNDSAIAMLKNYTKH